MVSEQSVVLSKVGSDAVEIAPFVYISANVEIGKNVVIHPHVTISEGVRIGDDVEIFPGSFLGKSPKGRALGTNNSFEKKCIISSGVTIGPNAVIYYGNEIGEDTIIGDGVSIRENVSIGENCIIGRNTTINYGAIIGKRVKIMDLCHITARVIIHDDVFIGPHVCTADDNSFGRERANHAVGGTEIFSFANIGEGTRILPLIRIGEYATVAAGAVVTKDVAAQSVVMGVPAKSINR